MRIKRHAHALTLTSDLPYVPVSERKYQSDNKAGGGESIRVTPIGAVSRATTASIPDSGLAESRSLFTKMKNKILLLMCLFYIGLPFISFASGKR